MIILYRDDQDRIVMEECQNTTPTYLNPDVRERCPGMMDMFCLDCNTVRLQDEHGRCDVCQSESLGEVWTPKSTSRNVNEA